MDFQKLKAEQEGMHMIHMLSQLDAYTDHMVRGF